eukprot:TRINITY_DN1496_c0_g1_i1.p1 TRINITY_DN1496_c0_g1~~TRINITY_DN1496_c0_g1_i1.p1  ORF type:complete len:219 (+),score=17.82 TRINITY_DN1496_c0_g1_i1:97-657(+)
MTFVISGKSHNSNEARWISANSAFCVKLLHDSEQSPVWIKKSQDVVKALAIERPQVVLVFVGKGNDSGTIALEDLETFDVAAAFACANVSAKRFKFVLLMCGTNSADVEANLHSIARTNPGVAVSVLKNPAASSEAAKACSPTDDTMIKELISAALEEEVTLLQNLTQQELLAEQEQNNQFYPSNE